jgi:hypothetical protein
MPDQCYYNGNFYQAKSATTAGETPDSAPAKWSKIQIPAKLRWCLARLTYAHLLELDGQKDKARVERKDALEADRVGLEDLIRDEANAQLELERPRVVLRGVA